MDHDSTVEPRQKRIEELLYIIGGCEIAIRHNKPGMFGSYPPLGQGFSKLQEKYLKKLERLMHGLPEDES